MTTGVIYSNYGAQLTVVGPDGTPSREKRFIEETGMFFSRIPSFSKYSKRIGWRVPRQVLDQPNKIVLSKKTAEKYFGQWQEATGKYIRLDNLNTVAGSRNYSGSPGNSDFQFKAIGSYPIFKSNQFLSLQ